MNIDPTEFPAVTLGGKSYTLKLNAGSLIRMKRLGLALEDLKATQLKGADAVERLVVLLQGLNRDLAGMDAEAIADMIEFPDMKLIGERINEALKKVASQAEAATASNQSAVQ